MDCTLIINPLVYSAIIFGYVMRNLARKYLLNEAGVQKSDHYILSREWRVIVDQVPIIMVGLYCYNQSGVTESC